MSSIHSRFVSQLAGYLNQNNQPQFESWTHESDPVFSTIKVDDPEGRPTFIYCPDRVLARDDFGLALRQNAGRRNIVAYPGPVEAGFANVMMVEVWDNEVLVDLLGRLMIPVQDLLQVR